MKNIVKICLVSLVLMIFVTACGQGNDNDERVLVMGTSADFPPFQFFDLENDNDIIGFDIDLARYIANELGYELEVVDMDFNTLITALRTGRVDKVLASMTPTPERREAVDFSDIYFMGNTVILTTNDVEMNSMEDLNGKVLGVQTGSIQEKTVTALQENGVDVETRTMDRIPELIQQLISGRIDGVVIEDMVTAGHLEVHSDLIVADILEQTSLGSAIAVAKGSELTEQINEVLAQMRENGELERLAEIWFN